MMLVVKISMIAVLIYACYVQLNDHDGVFWIVFYGLAALLTVASMLRDTRRLALAASIAYVVATIVIAIGVDRWHIDSERARETVGIAICAVWMLVLARTSAGRLPGRR